MEKSKFILVYSSPIYPTAVESTSIFCIEFGMCNFGNTVCTTYYTIERKRNAVRSRGLVHKQFTPLYYRVAARPHGPCTYSAQDDCREATIIIIPLTQARIDFTSERIKLVFGVSGVTALDPTRAFGSTELQNSPCFLVCWSKMRTKHWNILSSL